MAHKIRLSPDWVTAIATTLQTIAVVATLLVAAIEYYGHTKQDQRTEREAVIKLFTDEPPEIQHLRDVAGLLHACIIEKRDDPANGFDSCPKPFPSGSDAVKQLTPLIDYLGRVSLCRETGVCDLELSSALYCTDAVSVFAATSRQGIGVSFESRSLMTDYKNSFYSCIQEAHDDERQLFPAKQNSGK